VCIGFGASLPEVLTLGGGLLAVTSIVVSLNLAVRPISMLLNARVRSTTRVPGLVDEQLTTT